MTGIIINKHTSLQEFREWESEWNNNNNVSIEFCPDIDALDIRRTFELLLSELPNEFYSGVLETLAERADTPIDLLDELFDKGDIGCQVSICLRDDLPVSLIDKCRRSTNPYVQEHFHMKHSLS